MLSNLDFRNLFIGRLFLNLGDSLVYIIFMWFLYNMTGNSLFAGIGGFFFTLPPILGIFFGPIVDRKDNRKLLVLFSAILLVLTLVLAVLTLLFGFNVYLLLLFIPLLAFVSEFSYPVGESLVPRIVPEKYLTKANSLAMIASTGADLFFNAISAVLISFLLFDQLLLLISFVFLLAMIFFRKIQYRRTDLTTAGDQGDFQSYLEDLREGLAFVRKPLVVLLLMPLLFFNIAFAMFYVGLPEFVSVNFESSSVYGFILMLLGIGSMVGAWFSEFLSSRMKIGYLVSLSYSMTGLSWLLAILALNAGFYGGAIVLVILSGGANGVVNIAYAVLFQKLPPQDMIGRVHTINMTLIQSITPIASLFGGILASSIGASLTLIICGILMAGVSVLVLWSRAFRKLPKIEEITVLELE